MKKSDATALAVCAIAVLGLLAVLPNDDAPSENVAMSEPTSEPSIDMEAVEQRVDASMHALAAQRGETYIKRDPSNQELYDAVYASEFCDEMGEGDTQESRAACIEGMYDIAGIK